MARKNKNAKDALSQPAQAEQGPKTLVGIEVDGTEVHVAYVEASGNVRVEHFRDTTPRRALAAALKSIPGRADVVRVAFTGGRQYVRRVEVPKVPEPAMRAAMMAVAEENLPVVPGAAAVAGLIVGNPNETRDANDPRGASNEINMVIAAVESDDLDPVWRQLGGRRAPITSAAFLLPADGLYLRVARATSEMIILKGGVPLLARSLRVGGLDELERRIHEGEQAGYSPNIDGSNTNPDAGKSAAEITDSYLDELVAEFRKTLVFWKREGTDIPSNIIILGAGATIPTLLTRVRDAGFNISPIPEPRGVHLNMADHEKPVAFQALAAAYSDFSQQPYAILPNPVYEAQKALAKRKAKQRFVALVSLIALGAIVAAAALPWFWMKGREVWAEDQKRRAEADIVEFQALIDKNETLKRGEAAVKVIEEGIPAYTRIICSVKTSAPVINGQPAKFRSLSISTVENGANVDTSVQVSDTEPGFQVFGDWQVRLERTISKKEIGVGSFRFNPDTQTKDASFRWTVPLLEAFLVPNIQSCDEYNEEGLSDIQQGKVALGYDANDETVEFDANGRLVLVGTEEPAPSKLKEEPQEQSTDNDAEEPQAQTEGGE